MAMPDTWTSGFGIAACLVQAVLALVALAGRFGPGGYRRLLVGLALALGALAGLAAFAQEAELARLGALAETAAWTLFLAAIAEALKDPPRRLALAAALLLGALITMVAPSDPWLMGTAAVAIIGIFLATGLAGSLPGPPAAARRLLFFALTLGFAFEVLLAALTLADAAAAAPVEGARPAVRALLAPLIVLHLAAIAPARVGASAADRRPDSFIGHHRWRHRYDYRQVWPAFVDTLSGADPRPSDDLPERIVRAVVETVGAGGGAIWLVEGGTHFRRLAARDLVAAGSGDAPALAEALAAAAAAPQETASSLPESLVWPAFLPERRLVWSVHSLMHKSRLLGLLVLAPPPIPRPLDGEDRELLRLLSRQAAFCLAEDEATRQLADMRQYESFTRRFAYVMHDVKNVANQLSLTLVNARRHRGNQDFYDDMLETLEASVARMNGLIDQLRNERDPRLEQMALAPLLRRVAARRADPRLVVAEPLTPLAARAEPLALESALEHLLDNALEAVGPDGQVKLGLERRERMAALVVADDGPGLPAGLATADSRRRAFASGKSGGLGLGLEQARHTAERVGGRCDVSTAPGVGTTIALCLPGVEEATP